MFYSISIGIDPIIIDVGNFQLSWHGFFTFVAVAAAVVLVARWGRKEGIIPDTVYSVAVWGIIGGIIGARVVHVIDLWNDVYRYDIGLAFAFWQPGVAIYGAVIGGFVGGAMYIWVSHYRGRMKDVSVGRLSDITAPAILIAQAIGRIGDVINGEHIAKGTDLAWGFIYTHTNSPSNRQWGAVASHPAVVYEMIWDLAVLAVIWKLRGRLAPPGMLFALYAMLYALGRFFIQFLRLDKEWVAGLSEAQIISLVVLAITVPLFANRARWVKLGDAVPPSKRSRRASGRS